MNKGIMDDGGQDLKALVSKVYHEDCMLGMARYPDQYFDLAIVDPPYGLNIIKTGKLSSQGKHYAAKDWDKSPPDLTYFKELLRVSKHQIIWGANHFISRIPFDSSCWIVWDKNKGEGLSFADCELAWTSFKSPTRKIRYSWDGFRQEHGHKEQRIHPTQKPVYLYQWLLKHYAKPGQKILDTHLGSASSRIAAYDMGCDFIGFELDRDYFIAADERFKTYMRQLNLFIPPKSLEQMEQLSFNTIGNN